ARRIARRKCAVGTRHDGPVSHVAPFRRRLEMMLKNKVAVIYGAGGGIGGAVARAFAREGAKAFLTGRHWAPVESVAKDIVAAGGFAEAAGGGALRRRGVDKALQALVDKAGPRRISVYAIRDP